jgi:small conductance mechanosensitive channel
MLMSMMCSVLLTVPDQPDATAPTTSNKPGLEAVVKTAGGLLTQYGLRVVGALAFLVIAFMVSSFLVRLTVRTLTKAHVDVTLAKFLSNLSRWGLLAVVIIACLDMFGVPATSFVAVLGTVGLAIGLALQGSLAHMAAGVMLLLFRPFNVGDSVTIAGQKGVVDEIELFTTRLDTPDKRRVIIPNGQVFGAIIENTTFHPDRRLDIPVSVSFSADIAKTRQVLLNAVKGIPGRIVDREPEASIVQFGKFSVDWMVMVWVMAPQFGGASQAAMQALKEALDKAGLGGPVPQVVVLGAENRPAQGAGGSLAAAVTG